MIHWLRCVDHQCSLRTSKVYHLLRLSWCYHRGRNCQRTPPPRKSLFTHLLHFVNTDKGTSKCFHSRRKIQRKTEEIRPSCSSDHDSVPRTQKQVFPADAQVAFPKWTWLTQRPLENTCLAEKQKNKKNGFPLVENQRTVVYCGYPAFAQATLFALVDFKVRLRLT